VNDCAIGQPDAADIAVGVTKLHFDFTLHILRSTTSPSPWAELVSLVGDRLEPGRAPGPAVEGVSMPHAGYNLLI
jgi:hypothetical protein